MPKTKKRKFRGTTIAKETPRGILAKIKRDQAFFDQFIEYAEPEDMKRPADALEDLVDLYEKTRAAKSQKYGTDARARMLLKKSGQELAADLASGKISPSGLRQRVKGLVKVKKGSRSSPDPARTDAGVPRGRNVKSLRAYTKGLTPAHKADLMESIKEGPSSSLEFEDVVRGSKTKRIYQKKMIPGPVGYLPVFAALINEIRMGQERKKKKNG